MRYTKKCLSKVNHSGVKTRLIETESAESLTDTFDLVRELNREQWIDGSVTLFRNKVNPNNIVEVVGLQTAEVKYHTLFEKLFTVWSYIPFRQFESGQRGRVIAIESHTDDGFDGIADIRVKDLIAMLHTMDSKTPSDASVNQSPSEYRDMEKIVWTEHR